MKFSMKHTQLVALLSLPFLSSSAFSLAAATASSGLVSATVRWQLPSERANGEALAANEIGGYELTYRLAGTEEYQSIVLNQPAATEYQLAQLQEGEYEFRVAAFDSEGLYSDFSDPTIVQLGEPATDETTGSTDEAGASHGLASAVVRWQIPEQREDGAQLSIGKIGGYEIAYRLTEQNVFTSIVVHDALVTQHELANLVAGEYEFTIAAFDEEGLYSDFSEPTIVTLGEGGGSSGDAADHGSDTDASEDTASDSSGGSHQGTGENDGSNASEGQTDSGLLSATVSWQIPDQRENGEGLATAEIGGYEIAYRNTNVNTFESIIVEDAQQTQYAISSLAAGEYEFTIAAFDHEGLYSDFSDPTIVMLGSDSEASGSDSSDNTTSDDSHTGSGSEDTASNDSSDTSNTEAQLHSVNVNWQIPEEREDGQPLIAADIGGYEIAYRNTSSQVFESVVVNNAMQTQQAITNLAAGEYEFTIAAFDSEGLYSDFSQPTLVVLGSTHSNGSEGNDTAGTENNTGGDGGTNNNGSGEQESEQTDQRFAATIQWITPEEREDGSALFMDELGGFEIAYRNTQSNVFETVIVNSALQTEYVLNDLAAGEYEISIAAFDSEGLYSDFSDPTLFVLGGEASSEVNEDYADSGEGGSVSGGGAYGGGSASEGSGGTTDGGNNENNESVLLTATVQWQIPSQREDGSVLTLNEIGGYEVAYRHTSSDVFETVVVNDRSQNTMELTQLNAGEYEFIIAAFDSEGLYSDFSEPTFVVLGGGDADVANQSDSSDTLPEDQSVADGGGSNGSGGSSEAGSGTESTEQNNAEPSLHIATISWAIPSEREDGQALLLSDIGGYEIMYRPIVSSVFESVIVEDQTQTEIVLGSLSKGEYEFIIAAYDSEGLYSEFSEPTVATIGM